MRSIMLLLPQTLTLELVLALRQGIAVAEARGDVQAAKEMRVFLRRLEKSAGGGARED